MNWIKIIDAMPSDKAVIDIWIVNESGGCRVTDATWCKDDNIFSDEFGGEYDLNETTHWRFGNDKPKEEI